ncbi:hypothetical protein [Streptomyces mirabilis]
MTTKLHLAVEQGQKPMSSGLGTTERDYAASCPGATIGKGLAVHGEEVREADAEVRSWLRRIGVLRD